MKHQVVDVLLDLSIAKIMSDGREALWYNDETCQMCGQISIFRSFYSSQLVKDHCHVTGLFRGMLCRSCNTLEGQNREIRWLAWRMLAPGLTPNQRRLYAISEPWEKGKKRTMPDAPDELQEVPMFDLLGFDGWLGLTK